MSSLTQVSIAVPEYSVDASVLKDVGEQWLSDDSASQEKFLRISAQSGVSRRRFILPYDEILALNGLEFRAKQFELHGTQMLHRVVAQAIEAASYSADQIGAMVFTSCSVPVIPSIDAKVILESDLPKNITRVPMYQHGCAGGVVGLALGSKLAELGKPVLVSSVELCSLVFQPQNRHGSHLVGAAIFADGAAATVVSPSDAGCRILGSESVLLPESRHLMGYDIFDDGFHLRLDRSLPSVLVREAPKVVANFLDHFGKRESDIDYWLFHPGGIKILEFLKDTLHLSDAQCPWSFDVLREHGNLSSATILFVLETFLRHDVLQKGECAVVMGIGPGLTIEMILLEG